MLESFALNDGESRPLAPGMYGDVVLNSGSTLILEAGEYGFTTLILHSDSRLDASAAADSVLVVVDSDLEMRSAIDESLVGMVIAYQGTGEVIVETSFTGMLVAPDGRVVFEGGAGQAFAGQIFAKEIHLRPDAAFQCIGTQSSGEPGTVGGCTCDEGCEDRRFTADTLGTTDAVCYEISEDPLGWTAWLTDGRTIEVNDSFGTGVQVHSTHLR